MEAGQRARLRQLRRVDHTERRARLARRHHLAARTDDVVSVADDLVGFHSSDPATVYLSARARVDRLVVADVERALYQERRLVRMLGMRRTMFVVSLELAPVIDAACTKALAPAERKRLVGLLEAQSIAVRASEWLDDVAERTMAALARRGEATAAQLTEAVPELARQIRVGEGKSWAGTVGVSTRVLFLLATEGRIVRGRPLGSWISSQYRWVPTERWVDGGFGTMEASAARVELARRWLRAFGPGTVSDLRWWTGWTVRQAASAIAAVGSSEVDLDGQTGHVLADDLEPVPAPEPWIALLPGLDPTVMGWKDRDWYLGDHRARMFDRNGNAGPTVWCDGRVVGGWAQRSSGEVAVELLEDVGSEAEALVEAEAARLGEWLGEVRVTPRFRTPLEKELTGRA